MVPRSGETLVRLRLSFKFWVEAAEAFHRIEEPWRDTLTFDGVGLDQGYRGSKYGQSTILRRFHTSKIPKNYRSSEIPKFPEFRKFGISESKWSISGQKIFICSDFLTVLSNSLTISRYGPSDGRNGHTPKILMPRACPSSSLHGMVRVALIDQHVITIFKKNFHSIVKPSPVPLGGKSGRAQSPSLNWVSDLGHFENF